MDNATVILIVLGAVFFLLVVFLVAGMRRVPIGAAGIVISMGRRTDGVREAGYAWLLPIFQQLVCLYTRERQVDVPAAQYFTADRARISFKTTLRVTVTSPLALFDQGPGTYGPFTRDGYGNSGAGSEEANVALTRAVQNSIRETVQALRIDQVMFSGGVGQTLTDRIKLGLKRTADRWGLDVVDVWLTDVDADDAAMRSAMQSEVRNQMEARGQVAAFEGQVSKGAAFHRVAVEVAESIRSRTGREVNVADVLQFLNGFYQNERALDIAMRSASGHSELMHMFYMQQFGMPIPGPMPAGMGMGMPPGLPARQPFALPGPGGPAPRDGVFMIGREGQIVLQGDGVSRQHARLDVVGGRVSLTDLGSTNGTFVNGRPLSPNSPTPLAPADNVRFGRNVTMSGADLAAASGGRRT